METRSGLKRVHIKFASVYKQLDNIWTQYGSIDRVAGTVVLIFTKMCSDALLRDKLMREEGNFLFCAALHKKLNSDIFVDLLSKVLPLLDRGYDCRVLALQTLCTITHHSGREIRLEIAKRTPTLVRILEEFPHESLCAEQVIIVVGHSASAALSIDYPPNRQLLQAIDIPRLLPLLLFQLKQPNVSSSLVDHALMFFVTATFRSHKDFFAVPSSINFLVACTRSPDIQTRSLSLSSLLRLHSFEARGENMPMDPKHMPQSFKRGVPKDLRDAITQAFGPPCESGTFRTEQATNDYSNAIAEYSQDLDLHKLALEIGRIIQQSEHFMSGDCCRTESKSPSLALPFKCWVEALPLCAKELRNKGTPDMTDLADIIHLKYLMLRGRHHEVFPMADRAIQRSPKVAYFYYVLSTSDYPDVALNSAKKGLMCPNVTNYIKHALLSRAVEIASFLGIKRLETVRAGSREWDEGVALLMLTLEDSDQFMKSAYPDDTGMKMVLCVQPLATLIIKGHDISPELEEFKESVNLLTFSQKN